MAKRREEVSTLRTWLIPKSLKYLSSAPKQQRNDSGRAPIDSLVTIPPPPCSCCWGEEVLSACCWKKLSITRDANSFSKKSLGHCSNLDASGPPTCNCTAINGQTNTQNIKHHTKKERKRESAGRECSIPGGGSLLMSYLTQASPLA